MTAHIIVDVLSVLAAPIAGFEVTAADMSPDMIGQNLGGVTVCGRVCASHGSDDLDVRLVSFDRLLVPAACIQATREA